MIEDFVTYELAVKLKEKGFRENVNAYYGKNENIFMIHPSLDMNDSDYRCSAPTISQVLKWLREEKFILIGLSPMQEYDLDDDIEWCAVIYKGDKQGGLRWEEELCYQSYEAAAIAGIEYCLDNLI